MNRFYIPQPQRSILSFNLIVSGKSNHYQFYRHDFQISFLSFFPNLNQQLKQTKCSIETNR